MPIPYTSLSCDKKFRKGDIIERIKKVRVLKRSWYFIAFFDLVLVIIVLILFRDILQSLFVVI